MNRKLIIFLIILALVLLLGGSFFIYYRSQLVRRVVNGDQPHLATVTFVVKEGWGVAEIADQLSQEELINSKLSFYWYLLSHGYWSRLHPGEYQLPSTATLPELVNLLINGAENEKTITIPEGWTIKEIDRFLAQKKLIEKGQFIQQAKVAKFRDEYYFLRGVKEESLEGYLFPDTYFVYPQQNNNGSDFNSRQLIAKMLSTFDQKVYQKYKDRRYPKEIKNFNQLITLASIIEKEANIFEDRCLVAGIFLSRIDQNHRLQACSTVNYLLEEPKDILKESDLKINSPYNTYLYRGLPPGPVSNPSLASIDSVIDYQPSKYWYFLSDKNGHLHFAKTDKEHQQNKKRYL